jgi:type II secretory pathway pseudopilin PulG
LVEVLVAGAILAVAAAAAAAMALAVTGQQEANARVARALNLQEQAARLYHLGMEPAAIPALLPEDPAVVALSFSTPAVVSVNGLEMQQTTCAVTIRASSATSSWSPGAWTGGDSGATRVNSMLLVRPTIR